METTKQRALIGFIIAAMYIIIILTIPHQAPAPRGTDNDFTLMYYPSLMDFKQDLRIDHAYNTHGFTYYFALVIVSALIPDDMDIPGWDIFISARIISALSSGIVLFLLVLWIGIVPGVIAALLVAINPLFLNYAYRLGTDQLGIALCITSVYLLSRGCRSCYLLSGLLFGLAVCVRYEFLIFVIVAVVYLGWKKRLILFIVPLVALLVLNFIIVDLPGGFDVLPYKYFGRGIVGRDHFDHSEYDNLFKILTTSPLRLIQVYVHDLAQVFIDLCGGIVLAPCIIGFLFAVWKNRYYALIGLAFLMHILYVNALLPPSTRLLLLEIIGVTAIGFISIRRHLIETSNYKRWIVLLCLFAPFLVGYTQQSFFTFTGNYSDLGDHFLELREFIKPGSRIMSIHRQAAFITGSEWIMWPEDIENIYQYCTENKIDFVVWSNEYEAKYRSDWKSTFDDPGNAYPEFIIVDEVSGIGSLFRVSLKNDGEVLQDSVTNVE